MLHRFSRNSRDYRVAVDEVREEPELVFRSHREAVAFLRRESRGREGMQGLRRMLEAARSGVDVGRLSDDEVLWRLGWLVSTRRVRLHRGDRLQYSFEQPMQEEAASALGPVEGFGVVADADIQGPPLFETELASKDPPLVEVGLSLDPIPGEESDVDDLDAAAQAATLQSAAESGAPFCEECERRKRAAAAAAAA